MNTSIKLVIEELNKKGIGTQIVTLPDGGTLAYFEYNGQQHALSGTTPDLSAHTGRIIVNDKYIAGLLAERLNIPTPATVVLESNATAASAAVAATAATPAVVADKFLKEYGTIVVKPLDSAHGNGITTGVCTPKHLKKAVRIAQKFSPMVLLQQQVSGTDLRVLVIGDQVTAVSERVPAGVVGDGVHSVEKLIEIENQNPKRGENYEKPLNKIKPEVAMQYLGRKGLRRVPAKGETVQVVGTANIGSGGYAINKTGMIPEEIARQAVLFAKSSNMFVCGVDFLFDEAAQKWYFLEANGSPSFGLHLWPSEGESIDVTSIFVDTLLKAYEAR